MPHVIGKTTPSKYDRYITLMHSSLQETSGRNRSDIISNKHKTWRFVLFPICVFWSQFGWFVKSLHNVQLKGLTEGSRRGKDSEAEKVRDEGIFSVESKLSNTAKFKIPLKKYVVSRTQLILSVSFINLYCCCNASRVASNFHRKIRDGQQGICYFNRLFLLFEVTADSRRNAREIFYTSKSKRDKAQ